METNRLLTIESTMKKYRKAAVVALIGVALIAATAGLTLESVNDRLCVVEDQLGLPVSEDCAPETTTTTSISTSTSTTTTSTTTTTTLPPVEPDYCVVAQIGAETSKPSGNQIKTRFDIMVNELGVSNWWIAPYVVDLNTKIDNSPSNWGWISGDRAGYKAAYMFLVNRDTGRVVARVMFHNLSESASYIQINDKFMSEVQATGLGYDGTCADGSASDPATQDQAPPITTEYVITNPDEVRPVIPIYIDGVLVEDRSYTNTVKSGDFRFIDLGITGPFTDYNGAVDSQKNRLFGTPHTVYFRQAVGAISFRDGSWTLGAVVYYDLIDPAASFTP